MTDTWQTIFMQYDGMIGVTYNAINGYYFIFFTQRIMLCESHPHWEAPLGAPLKKLLGACSSLAVSSFCRCLWFSRKPASSMRLWGRLASLQWTQCTQWTQRDHSARRAQFRQFGSLKFRTTWQLECHLATYACSLEKYILSMSYASPAYR